MNGRSVADLFASLVGAIGTESFPACFLKAMQALAGVELCSVFLHEKDSSVRLLFADGGQADLSDFSARASLDYARTYWRSDHQITHLSRCARAAPVVVRKYASDISDPAYRNACYDKAGIVERISIFYPGPPVLIANGYRTRCRPPFTPNEMQRLEHYAGLMMAAVERHQRLGTPSGHMLNETELVQSLMALHCGLSAREAEISAAMMLGETQEEIAIRKHLSHGSVVTYRRRAYGKLGVANRRDLVRLHRRLAAGEIMTAD